MLPLSFFFFKIGVWLLYNVTLASTAQQNESAIHIQITPPFVSCILSYIVFLYTMEDCLQRWLPTPLIPECLTTSSIKRWGLFPLLLHPWWAQDQLPWSTECGRRSVVRLLGLWWKLWLLSSWDPSTMWKVWRVIVDMKREREKVHTSHSSHSSWNTWHVSEPLRCSSRSRTFS